MVRQPLLSACVLVGPGTMRWLDDLFSVHHLLVDEWCVLYTGHRKDEERRFCAAQGARVASTRSYNGADGKLADYAAARNHILFEMKPKGRWCLYIDTDERLSPQDFPKVLHMMRAKELEPVGYWMPQRNYVYWGFKDCPFLPRPANDRYSESEEWPGWIQSAMVRLWENIPSVRFRGKVHEVIYPKECGLQVVKRSDVPIHHYGQTEEDEVTEDKGPRYLTLAKANLAMDPENPKHVYEVALGYYVAKQFEKAMEMCRQGHELVPHDARWRSIRTSCLVNMKRLNDAWAECRLLCEENPLMQGVIRLPDPETGEMRRVFRSDTILTPIGRRIARPQEVFKSRRIN